MEEVEESCKTIKRKLNFETNIKNNNEINLV